MKGRNMDNTQHRDTTIKHEEMLKRHDGIISDHERRVRWLEKVAFYGIAVLCVSKFLWDLYSHSGTNK